MNSLSVVPNIVPNIVSIIHYLIIKAIGMTTTAVTHSLDKQVQSTKNKTSFNLDAVESFVGVYRYPSNEVWYVKSCWSVSKIEYDFNEPIHSWHKVLSQLACNYY